MATKLVFNPLGAPFDFINVQVFEKKNVDLLGARNGSNRTFTTPDKFRYQPASGISIQVFYAGRQLRLTSAHSPDMGDFYVSESGGLGSGFDTVNLLTFAPYQRVNITSSYVPA